MNEKNKTYRFDNVFKFDRGRNVIGRFPDIIISIFGLLIMPGAGSGLANETGDEIIGALIMYSGVALVIFWFAYLRKRIHRQGNDTKKRGEYALIFQSVFENTGTYITSKSEDELVKYAPIVEIVETDKNLRITLITLPGMDVSKMKKLGQYFQNTFGYYLLSVTSEFSKIEYILQKEKEEVTNEYISSPQASKWPILGVNVSAGDKVYWDYTTNPHLGIFAKSGAGKSVFAKGIITQLSKVTEKLIFVDFKVVEFSNLKTQGYEVFNSWQDGLLERLELIQQEMEEQNSKIYESGKVSFHELGIEPTFIVIDEFASLVDSLPNDKDGKAMKAKFLNIFGDIARRGRSIGYYLVIITQRPDASIIPGEIRNNIATNVVLRGGNPETRRMVYGDSYPEIKPLEIGYAVVNDENDELVTINIPFYSNDQFLHDMKKYK